MKNRYYILLILLLVSGFSFAQTTYTMPAASGNLVVPATCNAIFVDTGGSGANYANNQASTITFSPATPGDLIRVSFTSFDVETNATCAYDRLEVWNGTTTAGPATGQYCGVLPAFSVISNAPGGQLTFRFTSDGITTRAGWVATVSCVTPCTVPVANLVNSSVVDICPSTSVTPGSTTVSFDASTSTAPGGQGPISRYEWKWSDGSPNTTTIVPTTTHTFPSTGGVYIVELAVRNSNFDVDPLGCLSTNAMQRVIRVLPPPNFAGSTASSIAATCPGSVNLTGVAATQNYTSALPAAESVVTTLPDGNGVSYTTGINYTGFFPTGATVSAGCYPTVTLNIEHSYSSDLNIDLIAPTGQTVRLFAKNGTTGLTTYKFGTCVRAADDGLDGCGATYTVVNPGTPGAINWTDFGTGAAQSGTTTTATCAGFAGPCETGTYFKSRTYNSATSFAGLVGAALNGTWSIRITDTLAADDGNLFFWNLTFPPACMSTRATANPDMVSGVWSTSGSGPAVPANSATSAAVVDPGPDACPVAGTCLGNSLTNTVSVGPFTAGGSYVYNYTVTDEFGCQYVRPVTVNVPFGPTFTVPANITQCTGSTVAIANFTSAPAGAVFTWTNSNTAIGLAASGSGSVPAFTATNATAAPITATITVTATPASGCPTVMTYTITINPIPTATFTDPADQCLTGNSFTFTNTGTSGAGYTHSWNFGGAVSNTSTAESPSGVTYGSAAGSPYTITHIVTDTASGCNATFTNTVVVFPSPTAIATTVVDATCGLSNGSITITGVTGGTAPYTYSVCGSPFAATTSYTGLPAGTCTVIVRDANNCEFQKSVTILDVPGPTALAITTVNSSCGSADGVINIGAVTGGVAPYTYSVNGSGFTGTLSYPGFAAGPWTVIVRDANGCEFTTTANISNNTAPTAIATTVVNTNCGGSNGCITITGVTGGVAPYTYSFNTAPGAGPYTATTNYCGLIAGSYNIEVKDVNGCVYATTVTVIDNPGPTAIATTIVNASCGAANGSVTITGVTGGTAPYQYSFNIPTGGPYGAATSFTGLAAGPYNVEVIDANGCKFLTTVTVINNPGPTAIATTIVNASCGLANGSVTITGVTGGTAPYQYSFNLPTGGPYGPATSFTGLTAGPYNVEVIDANGCKFLTTVTVIDNPGPTAIATTLVNSNCGASDGSITITGTTGGTAPYLYSFNVAAGAGPYNAITSFTNLAAGPYNIEVKDANGCLFFTTVTVLNNLGPTAIATTLVNANCGASTGSVDITGVTGGTAPYEYSFNLPSGGPYGPATSFTNLAAGPYNIEVKDANGCLFLTTVTIIDNPGPTGITTTVVNSSCGAADGCITITGVTGGTAPYTYSFDNPGVFTSTTNYCGLLAGSYPVEVKDANGCIYMVSVTVVDNLGPTAIATTFVNPSCGQADGSITITGVTGGTAPYTYDFGNPPTTVFSSTTSYTGLIAATYTIIVKDANGCQFTTTVTLVDNAGPTAVATTLVNSNCGAADGCVTIGAVTGGLAPYTFSFNSPSAYGPATNYCGLLAGPYDIYVKDANGCIFMTTITIIDNPGPTAIATTTTNSSCGGANGCIDITGVTGGTAPYIYSFNGSAFTATTNYCGLTAGSYTIEVEDINGCKFLVTVTVVDTPGPTAITSTVVDAACGASNGSFTIDTVTGGVAPYTYEFPVPSTPTGNTTYTGLPAGSYNVNIIDANGCVFPTVISINNAGGPTAVVITHTDDFCDSSNGTVNIGTVTGGTAPYEYSFNGTPVVGPFTGTTSYTGLAAGTYPIEVRDASGCIFATSVTILDITGPTDIATTVVNASCGNPTGSIMLGAVTGGTAPYEYAYPSGGLFGPTTSYTGLAAGPHVFDVRDANGCIYTETVTIIDNPGPTAVATVIIDENCGAANGSVTFGAVTGGTGPYSFSFDGSLSGPGTVFTGLSAGSYPFVITDANGCMYNGNITINNAGGPIDIATTVVDEACGGSNGSITLGAVTGGTAPYTYSIVTPATPSSYTSVTTYNGLNATTYTVSVKDANGCIYTENVTISNSGGATAIATTVVNETCSGSNGSITLGTVTGGTAPYTYVFNSLPPSGNTSYTGLPANTYTLDVIDANGCTYSTTITIINSPSITNIATTVVNATCGLSNGSITLGAVTGGTAPYTYTVGGSPSTGNSSGLPAGPYAIVVTDANGCSYSTSVTITDSPAPTAIATTLVNETCTSGNGSITLGTVTGGTAPYTYTVGASASSTNTVYTGLSAGPYIIVVTDASGCTYTTTVNITNSPGPTAIATTVVNAACGVSDGCVTFGAVTGGTAPYEINFESLGYSSTMTYCGLGAGSHPFLVRDANGCIFSSAVSISNSGGATDIAVTQVNTSCGLSNGSITLGAVTGGVAPYTYTVGSFPPSSTITFYGGLAAGPYGVSVQDANGCIYSETITIIDQPGPTAVVTTIVNSTCGNANGSITFGAVTGGTAPYTYTINGTYDPATSYTGLAAGPYLIGVRDANGCTFTQSVTITTTTAPTASITYANAPFCNTLATAQPVTLTGTGTFTGGTYSATPAGLNINAVNGDITPLGSTPTTYTVTYTIAPTGGCPAITATTLVTINPALSPVISCGAPTTTSVQFNWAAVPGATGYTVSYVISGVTTTVGPVGTVTTYSVTVTPGQSVQITVTPTGGFGSCFLPSTFTCTANSCVASSANISYTTPFCQNSGTTQSVTLTGTGNYTGGTYSSSPSGLNLNAANGNILPGSTPNTYTVTYDVPSSGGCPAITASTTVVVTVVPTATISYAGTPFCTSNAAPQAVIITGTGAYTGGSYTISAGGSTINAANGAITPSVAGNYTVTYTIPASGGCSAIPVTTNVVVTAAPTASISYATPFCISDNSTQPVTITGTGAYTGGIYSASGGLSINSVTGAIIPGSVVLAGPYTITYAMPASAGCPSTSVTTTVTINGLPVATATPIGQTICSGVTTGIALSSTIAGTTFTWTVTESSPTGATNGSGNAINQTLATTGSVAATVTYTITPTANGCAGSPITVDIIVNPSPNVIATPANQTICSGQTTGIILTSSTPGTTFTWTASENLADGASNGSGNFISQVLTATTTSLGTVTYTVTPTSNSCVGTPITVLLTVTPPPTATATPDAETICSEQSTNIALSSIIPGTIFNWNVIQTNVTGATAGTGNSINQILQTVGNNQGLAVYAITPVANGCPGETIYVDVTINPIPVVTPNPATPAPICSGETAVINLASNIPGTTFTWAVIATNVFGATSGTGDLISQVLTTVIPNTPGSVDYVITPFVNGCQGAQRTVTVAVNPRPEVFGSSGGIICSGFSPNITLTPSIPGTTFTWTHVATGVSGASDGDGSIIDQDLVATGTTAGTVVYTVTPTAGGCVGSSSDFTVIVNPSPTPTLEGGIICVDANGDTFQSYTLDTGFNNTDYDFVWYFNNSVTPIQGASDNTYEATEAGEYHVQVTNTITGCVSALVTATVTESYPATGIVLTASNFFSDNATITVTATPTPGSATYFYSLDNGPLQESNVFAPVSPGEHSVTVTDANGCTNETRTIFIIGYPHYFTPNGDGINDYWNIIGLNDQPNAKIYIFDRYGKLIKQISPTGDGWDGTYNGELLPSTDYWFTVEYLELGGGKLFKAHFSLKR